MKVLAYTSPARGHLNPMMGPLLELRRRGAEVHVRTLSPAVESVRAAGLMAEPIAAEIEALRHDDHEASNQMASGARSYATFKARAPHEVPDFEAALETVGPDLVLVDCTTYGAKAVAERAGLPWAESQPFLLQEAAPGVPPAGLGMRPMGAPLGPLRDRAFNLVAGRFDSRFRLPPVNAGRRAAGLPPLADLAASQHRGALTLYFTAEPFDYPRPLPPSVRMVGPGLWDPPAPQPLELPAGERPLVLVACSSEFQDDGEIAAAALAGLRDDYRLVVTTAGVDPATLGDPGEALVDRFLPHGEILPRADVVVCHGGMGVTQKALSFGVPVCVVPWGRDQLDVAAHVVEAEAGTRVSRRRLSPARLAAAVAEARARRPGAARVKAGYDATGGAPAAADALESLLTPPPRSH
ncbi:MAG TPA: nucleotide disphospho-sugar-binding domain-containing protein [Solirubrobacterales bacterium]|nr:nucleotide disphospho-sugar-binding domain-containing protein [Solirubrobacterales bacterium]